MPAAVFSYLFAAHYERDADDVAGIVLVSTLAGALLLPFLVSYALWLAR
jgi:predicted permease